ncbi:MAG TPA: ABC transporter ATP-binding protein, partial [Blastocatellia bacterium]
MSDVILETSGLTKRFGKRYAVDGLSLKVEKGDIFGFLGQNGAGKSTTIRMILRLVRPTSGGIRLLDADMGRHPLRALRRTGAIVESPAFYDRMSGRDNLRMLSQMSGGSSDQRISETLDIVGLSGRAGDQVRVYSHGMRQRLGIAQALLPGPDFVILDEPTDGLDPQGIHEVRSLIVRLRDELGLTVLLSSHMLHEVEQICNRVAIIDHGKLLYQGAIDELVGTQRIIKLRVSSPDIAYEMLSADPDVTVSRDGDQCLHFKADEDHVPRINSMLVRQGLDVMELSPRKETLEEVFLRLTKPKAGTDRYVQ